ncbi:MAG TPA: XVIPCD domain-containing protein [Luteibacter sp.]|uniref:XVIPCD domain-containing protein n=1 Tax=Luteibacter sp. TaxID=1886636 RepID=UPI002C1232C3|nr:XVIPCD domain-containing protein [Luteibacter sp.]HVI55551.1 XVIPCD domain-containing protein [Luteibacter sp.]
MSISSTDYALLAQDAYQDPVLNKPKELGGVTYEAIDVENNPRTGFQATAYKRMDTGEIVIAYRGTEFDREPVQDGGVDAGMVLAGVNLQTANSEAFTERVLEKARIDADLHHRPLQVTVTGHSLGGTLAEINASKYGLKGETFNAYGAAGLREGVPEGGSQVIDHVRAGDVVSAASPHFGEVRVYAAQKDIDTLSHAGYRDDSGILSPRNPVKAIDFDAHAIDNFVPNSKLLGQSIINPESEARYKAHEGMIDRYRNDVADIRMGLSAAWEIPKAIGELKDAVEHRAVEAIGAGVLAVEHGIQQVGHHIADGVHAVEAKAQSAWNTLTHPGAWFEHDKPGVSLDHTAHPDHPLFKQAREAVHELDQAHGRAPDGVSENVAGSLVVKARQNGLDRIDKAVLSEDASRIYAVQGNPESPLKRVAEMPTEQAASTSLAESSVQWQQAAQQAQQQAQLASQQAQVQPERAQPSPGL